MTIADSTTDVEGRLSKKVLEFTEIMKRLVPTVKETADWAPLAEFVAVDEFERVGTFLEVMDWKGYIEFLTQWAATETVFATTLRRISELPDLVYFEIEERHTKGSETHAVNSLTVFSFNREGKIRHLDVFLQAPR